MQGIRKLILAHWCSIAGLLSIVAVWLFLYINTLSVPIIQQWDEARNAINTQEMLQNGNWPVRYFQGKPEIWELKPPLLIWAQCLSTQIWGATEFGIRFPSAMAALGMAIITLFFLKSEGVKTLAAGICAVMILCMPAALHPHGFLFGDHDALLCFFQALMLVAEYRFLKTGKSQWAWAAGLSLLLGWLTKSIATGFVLPGIIALGLLDGKYRKNLFTLKQWIPFATSAILIGSYYLIREQLQPGYLALVRQEEWLGRFAAHPDANHDLFYYLKGFYHGRLQGFLYPAIAGIVWAAYRWKKKSFSRIGLATILFTLPLISVSQSKNYWYDLPLLFPFVICMAHALNDLLTFAGTKAKPLPAFISTVLFISMVQGAYGIVQSHNHKNQPNKKEILVSYLKSKSFAASNKHGVYCNAFNTDISFYLNNLSQNGYSFRMVEPSDSIGHLNYVIMAREDWTGWKKQRVHPSGQTRFIIIGR